MEAVMERVVVAAVAAEPEGAGTAAAAVVQ